MRVPVPLYAGKEGRAYLAKYKNIRKGNWKKAKKNHGQMSLF